MAALILTALGVGEAIGTQSVWGRATVAFIGALALLGVILFFKRVQERLHTQLDAALEELRNEVGMA